jgi:hypothetical protein
VGKTYSANVLEYFHEVIIIIIIIIIINESVCQRQWQITGKHLNYTPSINN